MLLFGSGKLPQVMKELGEGIKNLKKGLTEEKKEKNKDDDETKEK